MAFVENELRFDEGLPLKEDYDMCLQQIRRYRGVLTVNYAFVEGDFGKLSGGTSIRRNYHNEFEQFKLFKSKWGSGIVRGAATRNPSSKKDRATLYVDKYDFSHPTVKAPIEGV